MKSKSKNFIIPLVVYPFDVMVSLGETDEQLKKALSKYNVEWETFMECEGVGRFILTSKNQSIIRTKNYPKNPDDYGHLQHEIFHIVTHILGRIGMRFILLKSDEAYSYLVGYLTTEIYKKI